jgi:hypothetical protein
MRTWPSVLFGARAAHLAGQFGFGQSLAIGFGVGLVTAAATTAAFEAGILVGSFIAAGIFSD